MKKILLAIALIAMFAGYYVHMQKKAKDLTNNQYGYVQTDEIDANLACSLTPETAGAAVIISLNILNKAKETENTTVLKAAKDIDVILEINLEAHDNLDNSLPDNPTMDDAKAYIENRCIINYRTFMALQDFNTEYIHITY